MPSSITASFPMNKARRPAFLAGRFFCESIAICLRLCYNIGNYKRKYALLPKVRITGIPIRENAMKKLKICMISSSGGHYEQLRMLRPLGEKHDLFWVTEKTDYKDDAQYFLLPTGSNAPWFFVKMPVDVLKTLAFWVKEKPDVVITTGALIALPACLLAKAFGKKVIYIESFARVTDGNRTGRLIYKFADLFIYQWEQLASIYPNGVYGGGIY